MTKYKELLDIINRLLGPGGCPWDQEQTLKSLKDSPIEEACELKEAIELEDNAHILEELGDLFFNAVFLARLAEKEGRFTVNDVIQELNDKLIRRHPHVFGEEKIADSEKVKEQWEKIKKTEKGKHHRESALDSIPRGLPVLTRAHKSLKKMKKAGFEPVVSKKAEFHDEADLGDKLMGLLLQADAKGIDFEHILQGKLRELESDFRKFEKQ